MDLNDWLCIKCQAQPKAIISLCCKCFDDLVITLAGGLIVAVIVLGIMAGLLWWPFTWLWWLAG